MHILITRFSALGDVAMTVPVIASVASLQPEHHFTVVSKKMCAPLFVNMPDNVEFVGADFNGKHKGSDGFALLIKELSIDRFDMMADLHGNIRSFRIALKMWKMSKKVVIINKKKIQRWKNTRSVLKHHNELMPVMERYEMVFKKLGLHTRNVQGELNFRYLTLNSPELKASNNFGIAPFAGHKGKIYPLDQCEEVVKILSQQNDTEVFLFGAGNKELETLNRWAQKYPYVSVATNLGGLLGEMALMQQLDAMLTMDSSNMHLASLVGTRVVSIWGATHPRIGFYGWKQQRKDAITNNLPCSPCSAYGNKACKYKDYHCMSIAPQKVVEILQRRNKE